MAYNVSETARRAQWTAEDARAAAEAIKGGLDPMLRAIEERSGANPEARMLENRLVTDTTGGTMGAYYSALASRLPAYVNARRAYQEEQAKKAAKAAGGGGQGTGGAYQLPDEEMPLVNLMPPQYYLPMTNVDVRGRTGPAYATSPYGAIPMSTMTPSAAQTLAQRKFARGKMGVL